MCGGGDTARDCWPEAGGWGEGVLRTERLWKIDTKHQYGRRHNEGAGVDLRAGA